MKYKRFEDTPVWQQAADLAAAMFEWTAEPVLRGQRNWNDAKQVRFEQQKRQDTFRAEHAERMKEIEARIRSQQSKHTGETSPTNRDQDE